MDNKNKHIDDLFSDKANAHKADASFAKIDFEAIKANLPNAPSFIATPKAKPTNWFGLNTILITAGIVATIGFIFLLNKGMFNKKQSSNTETRSHNITAINDTLHTITDINTNDTSKKVNIASKQINNNSAKTYIYTSKNNVNTKTNATNNDVAINNSTENLIALQTFFSKLSNESQLFNINTSKDTFIICKDGTTLAIKANSFTNQNKALVKGIVQLEIKEVYNFTDIIANGLHTVSNSNLLESAGMVFINASQGDSKLEINIRNPIQVSLPSINKRKGMQLFYLNKNANDNLLNTTSNWIANGQTQDTSLNKEVTSSNKKVVIKEKPISWEVAFGDTDAKSSRVTNNNYKKLNNCYTFSIRNFGWINCDRFNINNVSKVNIEIQLRDTNYINLIRGILIFPKIKSVIDLQQINNSFTLQNLPMGEEAYFVSFKTETGKVLSIIQKIIITTDPIKADEYKDIPAAQVKAKLDAIGSLQ
jgi:hypothetical protein